MEFGLRCISQVAERPALRNPVLAAVGYAIIGALLGGLSLLLFPHHFIQNKELRLVGTILSPIISGLCMSGVGVWRRKRGQRLLRLDSFAYGFIFALAMAIVRKTFTS